MARLVFGMNQPLDGYVDHMAFAPSPTLFHHFTEEAQAQAGSIYGRQCMRSCVIGTTIILNGLQRNAPLQRRGGACRYGSSRARLKSVGPTPNLSKMSKLKAEREGEIEVAGPALAHSLTELG